MSFAKNLKTTRKEKHLSQGQLAEIMGGKNMKRKVPE